jgi:hypothetical protein
MRATSVYTVLARERPASKRRADLDAWRFCLSTLEHSESMSEQRAVNEMVLATS